VKRNIANSALVQKWCKPVLDPNLAQAAGGKGYLTTDGEHGSDHASENKKRYPVTTFFVLTGIIVFFFGNEMLYGIYLLVGLAYFIIKHG